MPECAKKSDTKCLVWKGNFENRCPVKMTKIFQLHPLAKIVGYSALSTCVHARVPGIPEVGRLRIALRRYYILNGRDVQRQ